MPDRLKRGRWGKPETDFMTANAQTMPVEQIASTLNRDVETVTKWIKENLAIDVSKGEATTLAEIELRNALRESPDWEELAQQFVEVELKTFERQYGSIMSQFRGDVTPTERMQILQLIKFNILMDRNLKSRARALQDVERVSAEINEIKQRNPPKQPMKEADKDRMLSLETQVLAAREAEQSKTNEYVKLTEKSSALMKELKGTRDQRITKWENSKETVVGLLRKLQDEEIRKQEGEDIEWMQLALEKERDRLSQSHTYVDDSVDQPLLTPENVG